MRRKRNCPPAPILPKETLEIAERRELLLTGVTGIEDYHTEKVRLKTCKGIVEVTGIQLTLCWAGEKRLMLCGELETVRFEWRNRTGKGGVRS